MTLARNLAVTSSLLASQLRGWRGTGALRPVAQQPAQPLALYEFEGCPYCRLVREVLTEMDLDVMVYPCPKGGTRYRPQVERDGGKSLFPYLVDANTGSAMYESADIIAYLGRTYGKRSMRSSAVARALQVVSSDMASASRPLRGVRAQPSKTPALPLELYSFESSPYSRLVREVLCELELPYLLRNTGKGRWTDLGPAVVRDRWLKAPKDTGRNRRALLERTGRVQVPYLIDANAGVEMFESASIIQHLQKTYAA